MRNLDRFMVKTKALVNGEVIDVEVFVAYLEAAKNYMNWPISPEETTRIHGAPVPLHLNEFSIHVDELDETFIFALSANEGLCPDRVRRDYTTREDGEKWLDYLEQMGFTVDDLLTEDQRQARLAEV